MKKSLNIVYGLILLTGVVFLLSERSGSMIGEGIAYRTILPFRIMLNNFHELIRAKEENDALSRMVVALSLKLQELREIQVENQRLKKILGFVQEQHRLIQPVQVVNILTEAGNTIMICKKKPYTIVKPDLPVVGYNGLIGKVKEVVDDYLRIQTIAHSMTRVAVIDSRSRVFGILKWEAALYLHGVPLTGDVKVGDTLVTSGMGAVYPKGIKVGIIKRVIKNKNDYQATILVEPFENLSFQEEVFILVKP
ncbi:MAG TPA: rod shape-determining protein MreC [candidate division WOR-3 bacterium]|uniref:Cell shape-determining protein MreC n=1 Tax=candidate division WOR-3 bacterium TaxID=2052148 RepID=A0A7C0ZA46_UNCW3|nr:rod shape-determining protein MreC [candidate division WOR-3 bacterium]